MTIFQFETSMQLYTFFFNSEKKLNYQDDANQNHYQPIVSFKKYSIISMENFQWKVSFFVSLGIGFKSPSVIFEVMLHMQSDGEQCFKRYRPTHHILHSSLFHVSHTRLLVLHGARQIAGWFLHA